MPGGATDLFAELIGEGSGVVDLAKGFQTLAM